MKGVDYIELGVYEKKFNKIDYILKFIFYNIDKNLKFKFGLFGIVIC